MSYLFYAVPVFGVIALLYTFIQSAWVGKQPAGNDRMKEIAGYIADGAMAFLKAEYKVLTYFVIIAAILLGIMGASNHNSHWSIAIAFIIGAFFSALAGFIGMRIATKSNVRTAEAAKTSLKQALKVSFTGGSVMGMGVAGLAVLGLGSLFIILKQIFAPDAAVEKDRGRFSSAPDIVTVVARLTPGHKVPEQEQLLTAGSVCFALLQAAQAFGFGAQWLTGWMAYDAHVARRLGLVQDERIVGFIHIGTPRLLAPERERPDPAALLTVWNPDA